MPLFPDRRRQLSGGARQVLAIGRRASPGLLVTVLATNLVRVLGVLALPGLCGRAIDSMLAAHRGDPTGAGGRATAWVIAAVVVLVIVALCEALVIWAAGVAVARATARTRRWMLGNVLAAGPGIGRVLATGDVVTRVLGNSAQAAGSAVRTVGAITSCVPVLGGVVLMAFIDVWCAGVFTVGLLALGLLSRHVVNTSQQLNDRYLVTQAGVAVALTEAVAGARTVAAAGASATERRRVLAGLPELHQHGSQLWGVQSDTIARGTMLLPAMQVVVLAIAGWRTAAGHLTVGQVFAISGYLALGVRLVTVIGQLTGLGQARGAARRCGELGEVPPTVYGPATGAAGPGAVTVIQVSAEHATEPVRALDVHIPAGQSVALVGADGCGKSTFAALIGRLAEPDGGQVCLDGRDVRELSSAALHRSVTYAFARPALLGRTITDTIGLGAARPDPVRVLAAARAACADGFISRLPDGYETLLTQAPMSGGEAQRLGLARAFAHPGRVLVLDDATSSLDTVTEHQISTALAAAAGRTRIIVARRASTAARAERVLWFHEGRIRGDGTHRALWSDPDYRAVFLTDQPDVAGRPEADRPVNDGRPINDDRAINDERPVKAKPVRPVFAL